MREIKFKTQLATKTAPKLIFENAQNINSYLGTLFNEGQKTVFQDSVLREWTFQWYSKTTGKEYNTIYEKCLNQE